MNTVTYSFGQGRPPVTNLERNAQQEGLDVFNDGMFEIARLGALDQSALDKAPKSGEVYVPTNPKTPEMTSGSTGSMTFTGPKPTAQWEESCYVGSKLKHDLHNLEARLAPEGDKPSFATEGLSRPAGYTPLTADVTTRDGVNYKYNVVNGVETLIESQPGSTRTVTLSPNGDNQYIIRD